MKAREIAQIDYEVWFFTLIRHSTVLTVLISVDTVQFLVHLIRDSFLRSAIFDQSSPDCNESEKIQKIVV